MGIFGSTFIDVASFAILLWYVYDGWRRGLFMLLIETISLIASLILALALSPILSRFLVQHTHLGSPLAKSLVFVILCVVVKYLFAFVEPWLHYRVPERFRASNVNHFFGVIPGAAYGLFVLFVLFTFVLSSPIPPALKTDVVASHSGLALRSATEVLDRTLTAHFGTFFKEMLPTDIKEGKVAEENVESIALPFKTTAFTISNKDEQRLFAFTNAERIANGLAALIWDEKLSDISRKHSADMLTRGYFSHITPEGRSPVDRADVARYPFQLFGENIALAPGVSEGHSALMQSPGHRANILSKEFTKIGIGIQSAPPYGLMITESFAD